MEAHTKLSLLHCIETVYEKSKESKLENEYFNTIESELNVLSEYFQAPGEQAFLLAVIFVHNIQEDSVDANDLIKHFKCSPLKMIQLKPHFNELLQRKLLIQQQSSNWRTRFINNQGYTINKEVALAISDQQPLPELTEKPIENIMELVEQTEVLSEKRFSGEMISTEIFIRFDALLKLNQNLPLVDKILNLKMDIVDNFVYGYCLWRVMIGKKIIDIEQLANSIFDTNNAKFNYFQKIHSKENDLLRNDLVELLETTFFNNIEVKLSNKSHKLLEEAGIKININNKRNNNLLLASKINTKQLFFNPGEKEQLEMLKKTMQQSMFKKTLKRLQDKNLPTGITVLLHGPPGTGKTESALQLARATKRDIFKIEISKSKSMWFGESEKIIKRIFTEYQQLAEDCERTPILLLNEADAIISKRKDSGSSNAAQTENAMQNILLEELENFKGILIATTNLINNLDLAFERRFLFKIELKNPEVPVKEKIWKSKLPKLKPSECSILAKRYNFSGGQIDNIVRKNEINEIINGCDINFNSILEFCKTEQFQKNINRPAIGFKPL